MLAAAGAVVGVDMSVVAMTVNDRRIGGRVDTLDEALQIAMVVVVVAVDGESVAGRACRSSLKLHMNRPYEGERQIIQR